MTLENKREAPFYIDGIAFSSDKIVIESIERTFNILDGSNAGRSLGGNMIRDIIGTFFPYNMSVRSLPGHEKEYEELFNLLCAPVDSHEIILPYGNGMLKQKMYIANGGDSLVKYSPNQTTRFSAMSINFVSSDPIITPGE